MNEPVPVSQELGAVSEESRMMMTITPPPPPEKLSEEEIKEILARQDSHKVSSFEAQKLEKEAKKNWDLFYKRNETRFFKDRHWTLQEFEEVAKFKNPILLEIGCGCGNFVFPMLDEIPDLKVLACDFSPRAIEFVKNHPSYDESRIRAFVSDVTQEDSFEAISHLKFSSSGDVQLNHEDCSKSATGHHKTVDFVSLIFVLSSISPGRNHEVAAANIADVLKPGGIVFFRDYGRHDMAQLRFKGGKKIDDNFYTRRDGTRVYYFTPEEVQSMFEKVGFRKIQCEFVHRRTINVKEGVNVERTFVQGRFEKCE